MKLLMLSDDERQTSFPEKIFNFYFIDLKLTYEKEFFLSNFKHDDLLNSIRYLTELFHKYPFYNSSLMELARNKKEVDLYTKWQRKYYIDIYTEHNSTSFDYNSRTIEIYNILQSNSSFLFLMNLFNDLKSKNDDRNKLNTLYTGFAYYYLKLKNPIEKKN